MKRKYILKALLYIHLLILGIITTYAQEARKTSLFNDNWKFYKGDVADAFNPSYNDASWKQVALPHDWSIEGPYSKDFASATAFLPGGIGWYRKSFKTNTAANRKVFVYFDGVYKNSEVWINGKYLGKRPNGFLPFQYEISKYLSKTGNNVLAVRADHHDFADSRWYTGSGIYRNVYLIETYAVHLNQWGVKFTVPEISEEKASANISVSVKNEDIKAEKISVKVDMFNMSGKLVASSQEDVQAAAKSDVATDIALDISNPRVWSVDDPHLYKLDVSLYAGGRKLDQLIQNVGIRSVRFDKDKGFFLNGKNMKLKGVCIHDDAGALGVAVPAEVWERRLRILKEGGCNAIRLSHNPHADYLYDLFDKLGFLVMDEAFDEWEFGKNKWIEGWNVGKPGKDGYNTYFKEWADRDLADMVKRDFNHPSIIMWSIGNEVDYPNDPYSHEVLNTGNNPQIYGKGYQPQNPPASRITAIAQHLVGVVKQIDTSRPVTTALAGVVMSNEVGVPEVLDLAGYNYQEFRYQEDHKKYPNRIIYGSENGMSLNAWEAVEKNDFISGQFLWTGIDYLGEAGRWPSKANGAGLIDLAGFPKTEYFFRKSLWSDKPVLHAATSLLKNGKAGSRRGIFPHWNYTSGDSVAISCFTNYPEAELFVNGRSLGRKLLKDAPEKTIVWNTVFEAGEVRVKGYSADGTTEDFLLQTASEPTSIKLSSDKKGFAKGSKNVAHVEIALVDESGIPVFMSDKEVIVSVEGPARLLALESGDLNSHEDNKASKRKTFHGRLMAYVEGSGAAGTVNIKVSVEGTKTQILELQVK